MISQNSLKCYASFMDKLIENLTILVEIYSSEA